MFSVTVSDHMMIAHSLSGKVFGPAQQLHGATYVVELEFRRVDLNPDGIVVDIGAAGDLLRRILETMRFRNLDELPEFEGYNTTTEYLCENIHQRAAREVLDGKLGADAAQGVQSLKVTLRETPTAWASYEAELR